MKRIILTAGLIAFSQAASAHTGLLPTDGFSDGFQHPFLGLDHFLVMLGLGLWASSQRRLLAGQAIALFLSFMPSGALLGLAGFDFAHVETAILVSLLSFGIALGFGTDKLPKAIILISIAVFAAMHGLAHGSEMPAAASAYAYIAGIVSGTAVLHVSGLIAGFSVRYVNAAGLIRVYGTLTGLTGAWLLLA
ncbi:MAG: HupE/UreJ family protein [Methylobacter sp.]|uniref:HupE/UreJ family protein n=1 Tax=Methylobacter sp. TaxID=2051955 RepID=UPI002583D403|nr:HupE/UreJ family protein [Methylobacter sp.]MCL7421949.1 HupE/UreJ family protein [Methylobacter sp.]